MLKQIGHWLKQLGNSSKGNIDLQALPTPKVPANQPLHSSRLIVLDLETTGLNMSKDSVIAIGAVAIQNNAIGVSGVAGSGGADGIFVGANGTVSHTTTINNNTIFRVDNFAGIDILANDASTMNATITNNGVDNLDTFALAAIYTLVGGASVTDTASMCADIRSNTLDAGDVFGFDLFVDQISGSASYRFPGYAGGASGGAALDAFLAGQNTLVSGVQDSSTASNVSGTGSSCPTP